MHQLTLNPQQHSVLRRCSSHSISVRAELRSDWTCESLWTHLKMSHCYNVIHLLFIAVRVAGLISEAGVSFIRSTVWNRMNITCTPCDSLVIHVTAAPSLSFIWVCSLLLQILSLSANVHLPKHTALCASQVHTNSTHIWLIGYAMACSFCD